MATDSLTPELDPNDQIQFVDSHRVGLEAGDYTLTVGQEVKVDQTVEIRQQTTSKHLNFSVRAERFELHPQTIHAVFPPPGSRGDFWHALPHVILNRSTLPWERTSLANDGDPTTDPPWLALLLFHEDEVQDVVVSTTTLEELKAPTIDPHWPGITEESGQHDNDHCQVIDVPWTTLEPLLPKGDDFAYRVHARRRLAYLGNEKNGQTSLEALRQILDLKKISHGELHETEHSSLKMHVRDLANRNEYEIWGPLTKDSKSPTKKSPTKSYDVYRVDNEVAVILGNRLPQTGKRNIAHLVSLEGRYGSDKTFSHQDAGADDKARLVSLMTWEFFCEDPTKDFKGILEGLNSKIVSGPDGKPQRDPDAHVAATFCLPIVPLPHFFRTGQASASWYHGPFVPNAPTSSDIELMQPQQKVKAQAADALLLFDETSGLFDVSYAAAWELGRMLTLHNTRVALDLFHWKRSHAHSLHAARRLLEFGHGLPVGKTRQTPQIADSVDKWFAELSLLQHIPFNYLVPDDRLLPQESLRIFAVDPNWLECLLDGAFSIGRVLSSDKKREPDATRADFPVSGLLLRSEAVSGWPGLQIDAYEQSLAGKTDDVKSKSDPDLGFPKLPVLRMERLSNDVLLCLFAGDARMIDIHLRPETLHFGFDAPDKTKSPRDANLLVKYLRDADGNEYGKPPAHVPIVFADEANLIVNLNQLDTDIEQQLGTDKTNNVLIKPSDSFTSADFALQMVTGVELVRFIRP